MLIDLISASLANLMPAIAGTLFCLVLIGRPFDRHVLGFACAAGYFFGLAWVVLLSWLAQFWSPQSYIEWSAIGLLVSTVIAAWILFNSQPRPYSPLPLKWRWSWSLLLWWVLLLLLAINTYLLAGEAVVRPVYPWDAWSAWVVKAKVWFALGPRIDFVSFQQWLNQTNPLLYTNEAWHYPEFIPRVQLWVMHWVGHWHEQMALLPWVFAYLAMLMLIYHTLRLLAVTPVAAVVVCYLIGSIPILNVQLALPGLVDLWMAAHLALFAACLLLWIERRQRRWLLASTVALAIIVVTKLEGLVWGLLGISVMVFASSHKRLKRYCLIAAPVIVLIWWLIGGIELRLGDGVRFIVTPDMIDLPYLGRFELSFSNQLSAFVESFLFLPNWHLTWYLLLPLSIWMVLRYRHQRLSHGLAAFAGCATLALFVLFFMTNAGIWAASMTASNRLALHFVPAWVMWLSLLLVRTNKNHTRTSCN